MRRITINLLLTGFIYFSNAAFAWQANECPCCYMIDIGSCMLAPKIAPHVKINFDFKKAEVNTNLFAIENCGIPFEISRNKPFIDGSTREGELLLVLCRKKERLDSKRIPITASYSSSCIISTNITCK